MNHQTDHNHFQVFEHCTLEGLSPKHQEALEIFHEKSKGLYYDLTRKGIKFKQFVGALRIGSLQIEVLPKADKSSDDKAVWQGALIQMLRKVYGFEVKATSQANLKTQPNAVFDLYFELFIKEVEYLIHKGLIKKYRKEEGNQTALKGSLRFGQHLQKNLVHQERFFVRYTTYDRINPYNQVLYKTLCVLQKINTSPSLQSRICSLLLNFPEMPDLKVDEAFFEKLVLNRKTEGYRKAIQISRLILLNYHPDLSKGRNDVLALMFDMNDLWEKYVLVCLRKAGAEQKITVKGQAIKGFWKPMEGYLKTIRPDIVLEKNDQVIVVDTKWKRPEKGRPDDGDLKQLFVYNMYWKARQSYLLYPGSPDSVMGSYFHFEEQTEFHSECGQLWMTVLNSENRLDLSLGKNILEKIDESFKNY